MGKNQLNILLSRFNLLKVGKRVVGVPWPVSMDDKLRSGLIRVLNNTTRPKVSKREQPTIGLLSDDGTKNDETCLAC